MKYFLGGGKGGLGVFGKVFDGFGGFLKVLEENMGVFEGFEKILWVFFLIKGFLVKVFHGFWFSDLKFYRFGWLRAEK